MVDYHSFSSMHQALSQLALIYSDRTHQSNENSNHNFPQNAHLRQMSFSLQSRNSNIKQSSDPRFEKDKCCNMNMIPNLSRPPPPLPKGSQYCLNR